MYISHWNNYVNIDAERAAEELGPLTLRDSGGQEERMQAVECWRRSLVIKQGKQGESKAWLRSTSLHGPCPRMPPTPSSLSPRPARCPRRLLRTPRARCTTSRVVEGRGRFFGTPPTSGSRSATSGPRYKSRRRAPNTPFHSLPPTTTTMAYFAPNSAPILVPPSPSDRPGGFYAYFDPTLSIAKYGRSDNPARRKREWERQCRGEMQLWLPFYWEVPFAAKFERLIHLHYQRAGYWLGPIRCPYCGVKHREKYDCDAGFVFTVEHYLGVLGWPIYQEVIQLATVLYFTRSANEVNGDNGWAARESGQDADALGRQWRVRSSEREKTAWRRCGCRRRVWYVAGFQKTSHPPEFDLASYATLGLYQVVIFLPAHSRNVSDCGR
ncbi:hypothetical protein B0H11DRAFT_1924165 [Mycena galericulata]|nr:hypothetical protein B0H11DRAFT_1924165 [Mycena galericulata]